MEVNPSRSLSSSSRGAERKFINHHVLIMSLSGFESVRPEKAQIVGAYVNYQVQDGRIIY